MISTHRKLVPALYNLAADGELPPGVVIVGFARRDKSDDEFRRDLEESTRKFSRQPVRDEIWNAFAQSIFITGASLAMKLATSSWPNVSRRSTRATARAATAFLPGGRS